MSSATIGTSVIDPSVTGLPENATVPLQEQRRILQIHSLQKHSPGAASQCCENIEDSALRLLRTDSMETA